MLICNESDTSSNLLDTKVCRLPIGVESREMEVLIGFSKVI